MNTENRNNSLEKKVLVACEESQAVTIELRKLGIEAYSCDIIDCSGSHDEWHIKQDVIPLLNGDCEFKTMDGISHEINGQWDMIIAFPPCTHLAVSGAKWFDKKRADGRQRAGIEFFAQFLIADCDKIAIENPNGIIGGGYIKKWFTDLCEKYGLPLKPTQRIQPYEYGDPYTKTTCLWLKGLPNLIPTKILEKPAGGWVNAYMNKDGYRGFETRDDNGKWLRYNDPLTARIRSKTYPGIAKAMAEQWTKDWR